jgi:hypothetical protein
MCLTTHTSFHVPATASSKKQELVTQLIHKTMTSIWLSKYQFWVYDPAAATTWYDVAGIYIFAGLTPQGYWRAYYIGQARSFRDRIPNHENWLAAVRMGATHVHAMVVPLAANRDTIEAELIAACQPAMNVQLK